MRFAYIDSQGKEVAIPSVEALQLRIELGAITEDTDFFDSATNRWAKAKEHEVFRTLVRESKERAQQGYATPPPPTVGPGLGHASGVRGKDPTDSVPAPPIVPPVTPPSSEPSPLSADGPQETPLEVELEEIETADDASAFGDDTVPSARGGSGPSGQTLRPPTDPEARDRENDAADPPVERHPNPFEAEEGPDEDDVTWDLPEGSGLIDEGTGGVIELAEDWDASFQERQEPEEPRFENSGGFELEGEDGEVAWEDDTTDADHQLDPPADGPVDHAANAASESVDRSPSFDTSFFSGDDGEMYEPPPPSARSVPQPSEVPPPAAPAASQQPSPTPKRTRPAVPPRIRRERVSVLPWAIGIVVAAGAGWFGWATFMAGGEPEPVAPPPVEIPEIAEYLEEPLERSALAASAALSDSLRALSFGLPTEPSGEWLSGGYLANASRFGGVREYWQALRDYLETVREVENDIFDRVYQMELDSMEFVGPDREALSARAEAGFRSAWFRRADIYQQLDNVAVAALDLHTFLVEHEDEIEHEPAVLGIAGDPVTEVAPASEELGEEMWGAVGEITSAMDALGALDRVTTERLLDLLFGKLAQTSID